jgi:hypothetical protein
MVAVIHSSSSLRNILNYNEQKVKAGVALCLAAGYYPKEAADLTFQQKLARLEKLTELNQRTKVNSVHISLNFDMSELLEEAKLKAIAQDYLDRIGFAGQPYLLYQHLDSGHPHLHLVTTNIKADGARISLHNLGRDKSEKARREIEKIYGLIEAERSALSEAYRLKPVDAQRVSYGKTETKRAIGNVLDAVVGRYQFASLAELNAVLKLYNVMADGGTENSRIRKHEGLVYRLLDERGCVVGMPIKASLFYNKPVLEKLNRLMADNRPAKEQGKPRLKNTIDLALLNRKPTLDTFIQELKHKGIDAVVRENTDGVLYGLTYVDHTSKVVLNGSDLGKAYSAKGILERCLNGGADERKKRIAVGQKQQGHKETIGEALDASNRKTVNASWPLSADQAMNRPDFAGALIGQRDVSEAMDWELKSTRKKRKKRRLRLN